MACTITMACIVLHNYCRLRNIKDVDVSSTDDELPDHSLLVYVGKKGESDSAELARGMRMRDNLIASYKI